jgi:hypothetical protein
LGIQDAQNVSEVTFNLFFRLFLYFVKLELKKGQRTALLPIGNGGHNFVKGAAFGNEAALRP